MTQRITRQFRKLPTSIPTRFTRYTAGSRHLFVAPDNPAWVVLPDVEADLLELMRTGASRSELCQLLKSRGVSEFDCNPRIDNLYALCRRHSFVEQPSSDKATRVSNVTRIQAHVTNRCNLRCPHCYVSSGEPFRREMRFAEWVSVIDYFASRGRDTLLSISGGEPLTVPWIARFVDHARNACGFKVSLLTNGLLWTESYAQRLAPNLDFVAVSLDGATAEYHDRIRGHGAFEGAVRAIRLLHKFGIKIVLNVTLMRSNRHDVVANLPELVAQLGVPADIDVANYVIEGRGTTTPIEALSPEEFQDALATLVQPFLDDGWDPLPISPRLNCGYGQSFAIYANGDVSPCLTPRFIRGNVIRDGAEGLFEVIAAEKSKTNVDQLPLCNTCDLRYLCGGRCHLSQLEGHGILGQNDCPSEFRTSYRKGLVARFDSIERAVGFADTSSLTTNDETIIALPLLW